ncbi:MAG: hypothetical protein ACREGB_03050, partial [Candidatus Saccharimonadales bacterium]
GSHYVALHQENSGDTVVAKTQAKLGLPEASQGLDILQERAAAKAQAAAEAAVNQPENSAEVFSLDEALTDVNALLQPTTLELFANQDKIGQLAAGFGENAQKKTDLHELNEFAKRQVFGPEQAAAVAKTINRESALNMAGVVQQAVNNYETMVGAMENSPMLMAEVSEHLPSALQLLRDIKAGAYNGMPPTEEEISRVARLHDFNELYRHSVAQNVGTAEANITTARNGAGSVEGLEYDIANTVRNLKEETEFVAVAPDTNKLNETVQQVTARGSKTVSDHAQACENDVRDEQDKVLATGTELRNVQEDAAALSSQLYVAANSFDNLPSASSLQDAISELQTYLYQARN